MSTEEKIDKLCGLLRSISKTAAVTLESQCGDERADLSTISKGLRAIGDKFVAACALGVFDLPPASTPPRADDQPRVKVAVINTPDVAAMSYRADDPGLPRLTAAIYDEGDEQQKQHKVDIRIGDTRLVQMTIFRGRAFAIRVTRAALKGAMSRLGKKRRLTANRAARVAPLSPEAELAATVARQKEVE